MSDRGNLVVHRNEFVGTATAGVLLVILVVGVAISLWSLSSILSLLPYFLILSMASALGWGFRSRLGSLFQQERKRNAKEPTAGVARKVTPEGPERQTEANGPRGRQWPIRSLQLGPVAVEGSDVAISTTVPLHSSRVKIRPGLHQELPFLLNSGDKVEGTATDYYGRSFDWYFLDDQNYAAYYADRRPAALAEGKDTPAAHIDIRVPHPGTWHLVLDARGKRSSRSIEVRLTKVPRG